MRYLLLALVALGGLGASAALATDLHPPVHPSEPHPGLPHPPVEGVPCDALHPCQPPEHPPVTVTVTTPRETVTVERPAPPPATVTTPAPPAVTVTTPPARIIVTRPYPPCAKGWKRVGVANCYKAVVVTKVRTVVKTKVVCPDPPPRPKPKDCEGDCDTVYKGANG
jgi:hypothetical protein